MNFSDEQKEEFKKALLERKATKPCPRCGNVNFILVDGYFSLSIQRDLKRTVLGGMNMPVVAVVCDRCGFLSQHALGVLGLLPEEDQGDDAND